MQRFECARYIHRTVAEKHLNFDAAGFSTQKKTKTANLLAAFTGKFGKPPCFPVFSSMAGSTSGYRIVVVQQNPTTR